MKSRKNLLVGFHLFALATGLTALAQPDRVDPPAQASAVLNVNVTHPSRRMAGGIGASWHAIRVEFQPSSNAKYEYPVREKCPQGSAVGANPRLDSPAWKDVDRLASGRNGPADV